ncbi:hypothetical protein [Neotabrizicola sp. sgz301269]|uniref:hypothetical protein n=1 Tax=Neotabrizicola sp. sgz301269 TaxID=3276282 RepID=UPI00376F5990
MTFDWRKAAAVALVCGSTGLASLGSANAEPRNPLLIADVQAAARLGMEACLAFLRGIPLSGLEPRGFAPFRVKIDNPKIFSGGSQVRVTGDRRDCRVLAGPAYPAEVQTLQ